MKYKSYIISAILLAATTAAIFVGCKKEKNNDSNKETINQSDQLSEMDQEMIAFGERLKSTEKGQETMPLEDAIKTLSNYENFCLCDASNYSLEMIRDTFGLRIKTNNGNVSLYDLNLLFENNKSIILEKFNKLEGEQKVIYCIKTCIGENFDRNDTDSINVVTIATMSRRQFVPSHSYYFVYGDCWFDFEGLGSCDGNNLGKDCITELRSKIALRIPNLSCGQGYRIYLTDEESAGGWPDDYPDSSSPNGYYALPYRPEWLGPQLLDYNDLNYYLNKMISIYQDLENSTGKTFTDFILDPWPGFYIGGMGSVYLVSVYNVNCTPTSIDD